MQKFCSSGGNVFHHTPQKLSYHEAGGKFNFATMQCEENIVI
jgi:hypothetical protein